VLYRYFYPLHFLLMALGLVACQPEAIVQASSSRPQPLPQEEQIQVYMNHEPASSYTEPYRKQTRDGDNFEQIIIDTIASAKSTVDVAAQEIRLPGIAQALVDRHQAGIKVRVILENNYSRPFSEFAAAELPKLTSRERDRHAEAIALIDLNQDGQLSPEEINQRDALVMLDQAKIPRIDDTADGSNGSNLMHHKFVVVDGQTLIVTSANFTTSDMHGDFKAPKSRGNANNLLKIRSAELATLFTQEFNLMWGDGVGGKADSLFGNKKPFRAARSIQVGATQIELQFSPSAAGVPWVNTSNGLIGKTLSPAQRSLAMALFVFSDQPLVNLIEPVHQRGTEIKTLIDPGFAYRPYSEGLDMLGIALPENCQDEADNRPWQNAIATVGVPRLPPGDLLHHKFGIVDQQVVITGSHNWTAAANTGNDETVLVLHSPIVAAHYQREFERLYTNAILGVPPAIQKKAAAQAQHCPIAQLRQPARQLAIQRSLSKPEAKPDPKSPTNHKRPAIVKRPRISSKPAKRPPLSISTTVSSQRVNLNTASQAELEELPGVGPGLAKRIIAARQQKPFSSLADLDQVSGVGPKLLKKLETRVTW
jgi:competence ComEA-like helix-hairpin-helix protein